MPTENRSSNTEMVSVPRDTVENAAELLQEYNKCSIARDLRAILALPAEQHQGELVAFEVEVSGYATLLARTMDKAEKTASHYRVLSHTVDVRPLYTHADPGEVERLREALVAQQRIHQRYSDAMCELGELLGIPEDDQCTPAVIDAVRSMNAHLAERDALFARILGKRDTCTASFWFDEISALLSASAKPSAPVERDERADFESAYCEYFNALPSVSTPITPEQVRETRDGDHYGHGSLGKNLRWEGWQMRAGLDRKPS